ncbi:tRNA lysidine(34) synthetase TilS [Acidaminobacter sp. JC074]|uniref:tRNA lysidine(34) synthetase TilS n=1 Tax=Acidaminobacter sp. JC074 TaxID=2530199 RepID=UPI001F0F76F2|nr:tRNA lysidine(34) synthetase TilS [Acidaminobacter sp. JC074]
MIEKMLKTIKRENLIQKGDKIVVAVSGGPDSVAMLHALYSLKDYDLTLYVCHLNHNYRGEASDGDAAYVKVLADSLNLESFIFSEDIEAFSKAKKLSFEEGARERRYALFDLVKEKTGANKIAVAQNMNDQAETLLMRLFRGSGLEGLTSIKYQRDHIIRPVLECSRTSIEEYCKDHDLKTRTDHTNFETDYTRNKIRLELLPYIKDHFNPNIVESLYQTSDLLKEDLNFIEKHVNQIYAELDNKILVEALPKDRAILSRLIRKIVENETGSLKGVSFDQINRVILLLDMPHGNKVSIRDLIFQKSYDQLIYYKTDKDLSSDVLREDKPFEGKFGSVFIGQGGIRIDADKVKGQLYVRTRRPGDKFKPLGMKGRKKLKDFFIDLKIPAHERDQIYLVCDDENIIWVVGYRMNEDYKVTSYTTKELHLSFKSI